MHWSLNICSQVAHNISQLKQPKLKVMTKLAILNQLLGVFASYQGIAIT
jgi:hypothetical protein